MGWWKVEGTQNVIGDTPLDTLGDAIANVVAEYEAAFNRKPTRAEWEALLVAALGADEPEARASDEGIARRVNIEMEKLDFVRKTNGAVGVFGLRRRYIDLLADRPHTRVQRRVRSPRVCAALAALRFERRRRVCVR
jgi:hypothetical protein